MYFTLISIGLSFLSQFIGGLKNGKAPAEVVTAIQSAIDALGAHQNDLITKANLEANRG
jgi:hypothetical protein